MCIYYNNHSRLHYTSQEHIFPAGIGGIQKLPKGYVSDEFNNNISKLEQSFLRESTVSAARQIEGPGKRGKLSDKWATKSAVHIIINSENQQISGLGYIKLGKTILIPNVTINTETRALDIGFDKGSNIGVEENIRQFYYKCNAVQNLNIRTIIDDRINVENVLFGIGEGIEENFNAFFARHSSSKVEITADLIQHIGKSIQTIKGEVQTQKYLPSSILRVKFNTAYLQIYGKIAFNFLAFLYGSEYTKDVRFDPVRNWINGNGTNEFAKLDTTEPLFKKLLDPKDQSVHYVMLFKVKDTLIAEVSFYGGLKSKIKLADHFDKHFKIDGFICDWKNRQEYRFMEYLTKIVKPSIS